MSNWVIYNPYHLDGVGNFAGFMTMAIRNAFPTFTYLTTPEEVCSYSDKKNLFVMAKPNKMLKLIDEFSKWQRVIGWCFEAVNTTNCDDKMLLNNRMVVEELNQTIEMCHVDRESATQMNCKWLPIGYSQVMSPSANVKKKFDMIFLGDNDPKKRYRYSIIHRSKSNVLSANMNSNADAVKNYIGKYKFGFHVPAHQNYTNVNWHRIMMYCANNIMPVVVGPNTMELPDDFDYIRLDQDKLTPIGCDVISYDKSKVKKNLNLAKTRYDFKRLIENVLHNKTVVVLGHTGLLGRYVHKYLQLFTNYNVAVLDNFDASSDNINEILSKIDGKIECIINCIGIIKQRNDISDEKIMNINAEFPHKLYDACAGVGAKMIHMSTDCVFQDNGGGQSEADKPTAQDIYGKSKILGEPQNATIIRTSFIGEEQNRKLSLLEWVRKNANGECNGYVNHIWNGVTALTLSKIICNIVTSREYWSGVRHIHSPECCSKYDLIKHISDIYNLNININLTSSDFNINRGLGTIYLKELNALCIPKIHNQILELKTFSEKYLGDINEKI